MTHKKARARTETCGHTGFICYTQAGGINDSASGGSPSLVMWHVIVVVLTLYFLHPPSQCLFVCLPVGKITRKVIERFEQDFQEMLTMGKGHCQHFTARSIFVMFWIPEGRLNIDLPQIGGQDQVALIIKQATMLYNRLYIATVQV